MRTLKAGLVGVLVGEAVGTEINAEKVGILFSILSIKRFRSSYVALRLKSREINLRPI